MKIMRYSGAAAILSAVAVLSSCGDEAIGPDSARSVTLVSGSDQVGTVGEPLEHALVVIVTNSDESGAAGVGVSWQIVAGGGSLSAESDITDAEGISSVTWRLGTQAMAVNTVEASVPGLAGSPITFSAIPIPGAPAQLAKVAGDEQTGPVETTLPAACVVRVTDRYGNPVRDVAVGWSAEVGGGSMSADFSSTDPEGNASSERTLGPSPGLHSTTAYLPDLGYAVVVFTAIATPAT
jgi:hypothetical protein